MKMRFSFLAAFVAALSFVAPARAIDYTVTAASVLQSNGRYLQRGTAAATITAGQSLAADATGNIVLFDADSATVLTHTLIGIAVNGALTGQPVNYVQADPLFTPGFTVLAGQVVVGSRTPGGLAPVADAATGDYVNIVGIGVGSNKIKMVITPAGVVKP